MSHAPQAKPWKTRNCLKFASPGSVACFNVSGKSPLERCLLLAVFLRSCKNILKFTAVVKCAGFKLLRNVTFQQGISERTTACLLQKDPQSYVLLPDTFFNGLHGCSDPSFHLDSLPGRSADLSAPQPQHSPQPLRTAVPLESPGICQRSRFFGGILPGWSKALPAFACISSSALQGCHAAAGLRLWGCLGGGGHTRTQSRYASPRFAYGCSSWSCCAKHFLPNRPDSCLPVMVTVASFPLASEK